MRSRSVSSAGSRSTSASPPNATTAAWSPSGRASSASRTNARADSRPAAPDAVGQVDHEHGGQPVDRQLEREAGERQHERREDHRAQHEAHAPAALAQVMARGEAQTERDHEQKQADDEQLRPATENGRIMRRPSGRLRGGVRDGFAARIASAMRRAPSRS